MSANLLAAGERLHECPDQLLAGVVRQLLAAVDYLERRVAQLEGGGPQAAPAEPSSGLDRLALALGNGRLAAVLVRAGYTSPEAVAAAGDEALLGVEGVSRKTLAVIREKIGQA